MNKDDFEVAIQILRLLWSARGTLQGAVRKARLATLTAFATPAALRNSLMDGRVTPGNTVKMKGYLSRYAFLYKPISYWNSQIDVHRAAAISHFGEPRVAGGNLRSVTSTVAWRASQNPVSALPRFEVGGEDVRCLFLYAGTLTSFLFHEPVDHSDGLTSVRLPDIRSSRVAIPREAYPIPVLVPAESAYGISEKRVELTAVVRELPSELAAHFGSIYSHHYNPAVLSNFLLTRREPTLAVCLSMLSEDEDTGVSRVRESGEAVGRAAIYVEGHLRGEADVRDILNAIPKASVPGAGSEAALMPRGLYSSAAPNDIAFQFLSPSVLGIYAETTPSLDIGARVESMNNLLASFKERLPASVTLGLDFVFDPDRQYLFDQAGSLSSDDEYLAGLDDEAQRARSWYRRE